MGRRKIRHYKDRQYYRELLNEYFKLHNFEVLRAVINFLGFDSVEEMRNAEITGCWFDCGWVIISPKNKDHWHEWYLDNDRISADLYVENPLYNTQSTTIKEIMVIKALKDLGIDNEFNIRTKLD